MTSLEEMFRDSMRRTMRNLNIIQHLHENPHDDYEEPYEVTQLANSFVSVLGLPRENDLGDRLETFDIEEGQERWGFPVLCDAYPDHPKRVPRNKKQSSYKPSNLSNLLGLIRNGFAHGNYRYLSSEGEIEQISICNKMTSPREFRGEITWGTTQLITTWRDVLEASYRMAEDLYETPDLYGRLKQHDSTD